MVFTTSFMRNMSNSPEICQDIKCAHSVRKQAPAQRSLLWHVLVGGEYREAKRYHLEGGTVNCAEHVMLCCQGYICGHVHQLACLQQRTRCLGSLGSWLLISAAGGSRLLLLGVLVGSM